jgi:hypothetical protein
VKARAFLFSFFAVLVLANPLFVSDAVARKKSRKAKGPPTTHPMILWSKTLSESTNLEDRRVNAYKLSQYSQPIFQDAVVETLTKCTKDSDLRIRVLCTKALGNASQQKHAILVRKTLMETFESDPTLKSTIARTFQAREDDHSDVQALLIKEVSSSKNNDDINAILEYFEKVGDGTDSFVKALTALYKRVGDAKVRRNVVKALSERSNGQDSVVELLAECAQDSHTPLALMCLSGLQQQARKDARAWKAIESTVDSDDPDVLVASLDVIQALPDTPNTKISKRLVELVDDGDDTDVQEKALLALGVCGDSSEPVVKALLKTLKSKESSEGMKIASALVLGKQGKGSPDSTRTALNECFENAGSKGLKTACQLGLKELGVTAKAEPEKKAEATKGT